MDLLDALLLSIFPFIHSNLLYYLTKVATTKILVDHYAFCTHSTTVAVK